MAKVKCSKAVHSVMARLGIVGKKGNASEHQEIVQSLQQHISDMKNMIIKDQGELTDYMQWKQLMTQLKYAIHDSEDLLEKVTNPTVCFPLTRKKIRHINDRVNALKRSSENVPQLRISDDDSHSGFKRRERTYPYEVTCLRVSLSRFHPHKSRFHPDYEDERSVIGNEDERSVIGRQEDKESLVAMLLSPSDSDIISYVSIVGVGGVGKTTLAQLVYNDPRIQAAFTLSLWICVSDDHGFSIREILTQILHFSGRENSDSKLPIDELQKQVRDQIQGNKYFLVLDDVWCEDREQWIILKELLNVGARGSTIMVTSRSNKVAKAIGDSHIHELNSLSEDNSWHLFQRVAFSPDQEPDDELFEIGKQIVTKCGGIPLTIRMIASLLFGQEKIKWLSFANTNLADIGLSHGSRIRLSYHAPPPEVQNCFEFCSIFPYDYVIEKEVLISMWLALGYLVPIHDAQSMEDIGEEYCTTLLNRSFFQDPIRDKYGEVISFKMHDLILDLARHAAGEDFFMLMTDTPQLEKEFPQYRHLSISESASSIDLFGKQYVASKTLRTIFNLRNYVPCSSNHVSAILSQCSLLRILDLRGVAIQTLPDTFYQVPYLRYLDLSGNEILEQLPTSVTKLHRLQILRLRGCKSLKELPVDMGQLKELRTLNIAGCDQLTSIPAGMNKWSCVHMFTMSIVGGDDFNHGNRVKVKDMKDLVNLKGDILVEVENFSSSNMPNATRGAHIVRDASLQALDICNHSNVHETLLYIKGYQGTIMSSITLSHCSGLQHLTVLSQLRHLKHLRLLRLYNVESIEGVDLTALTSGAMESMIFFPCLESLVLEWMPNLKGWWRDLTWMDMVAGDGCFVDRNGSSIKRVILPMFSCLRDLTIRNCPLMTYFPPCPFVKQLELKGVNETLCMKGSAPQNPAAAESSNSRDLNLCLDKLKVCYNTRDFSSLLRKSVAQSAVDIDVKYFKEESLQVAREGFQRCGSSVRNLSIEGFYELKSLSGGGIEHLTDLQSLSIKECFVLDLEEFEVDGEEEEEGMPWKSLRSLSSLTLDDIPKMVNLPKAFQYLTALESLHIKSCSNLEALGDCVQFLTSLKSLHIEDFINLKTLPDCFNSPMFQHIIPDIKNCPKLDMLHSNQEISVSE